MIHSILRSSTMLVRNVLIFCLFCISSPAVSAEKDQSELWDKLRSGDHFAMIRHALAPGTGDPPGFIVNKCETQRNLSEQGREQARRIGQLFRKNGISAAHIYSSQWCRCLETARLLNLGNVNELEALNSFFQNYENEIPQTEALTEWLSKRDLTAVTVLVTHQVNITAFTDIYPSSGEIVIVHRQKNGQFIPIGTIDTN